MSKQKQDSFVFTDVICPFLITRLFLLLIAILTIIYIEPLINQHQPIWLNQLQTSWPMMLGTMWARFDSGFYIDIAMHGYQDAASLHGMSNWAFFPLYPLLIHIIAWPFPFHEYSYILIGIAISNSSALVAMIYLYKLVIKELNRRIAARTVLYLLLFPMSFYLSAVYPESLFLALMISCIYYARMQGWWLAGLLGGLAALTRPQGVLMVIVISWEYWCYLGSEWQKDDKLYKHLWCLFQRNEWQNELHPHSSDRGPRNEWQNELHPHSSDRGPRNEWQNELHPHSSDRGPRNELRGRHKCGPYGLHSINRVIDQLINYWCLYIINIYRSFFMWRTWFNFAALLQIPLGLGLFCFYARWKVGTFFAFQMAERYGWHRTLRDPLRILAEAFTHPLPAGPYEWNFSGLNMLVIILFFLALIPIFRRLPSIYGLFSLLFLLMPLASGGTSSIARYYMEIFPFFILLSCWACNSCNIKREWLHNLIVAACAILLSFGMVLWTLGVYAIA